VKGERKGINLDKGPFLLLDNLGAARSTCPARRARASPPSAAGWPWWSPRAGSAHRQIAVDEEASPRHCRTPLPGACRCWSACGTGPAMGSFSPVAEAGPAPNWKPASPAGSTRPGPANSRARCSGPSSRRPLPADPRRRGRSARKPGRRSAPAQPAHRPCRCPARLAQGRQLAAPHQPALRARGGRSASARSAGG
jgi:hypothetical protein